MKKIINLFWNKGILLFMVLILLVQYLFQIQPVRIEVMLDILIIVPVVISVLLYVKNAYLSTIVFNANVLLMMGIFYYQYPNMTFNIEHGIFFAIFILIFILTSWPNKENKNKQTLINLSILLPMAIIMDFVAMYAGNLLLP